MDLSSQAYAHATQFPSGSRSNVSLAILPLARTPAAIKALYSAIGCSGLILNALSVAVILTHGPFKRFPAASYLLALGVADGAAGAFLFATTVFEYDGAPLEHGNVWHVILCKFWYRKGILWLAMLVSTFLIVAISADRCVAVVRPVFYKTTFSTRRIYAASSIVLACLLGVASQLPIIVNFSSVDAFGQCSVFSDWSTPEAKLFFALYPIVVNYFLPLVFMFLVYARIACALRKPSKVQEAGRVATKISTTLGRRPVSPLANSSTASERETDDVTPTSNPVFTLPSISRPQEPDQSGDPSGGAVRVAVRNSAKASHVVLKTSLSITTCYVCCYTLNQLYYFFSALGVVSITSEVFFHVRFSLVFLHCSLNPIIYCIKMEIFRDGVKRLFRLTGKTVL